MNTRKYLVGVLILVVYLSGCSISSTKPAFGPEHFEPIVGLNGSYALFDGEKIDDSMIITEEDGKIVVTNSDCKDENDCRSEFPAVKLPSFENTYVLQSKDDDNDVIYSYIYPWKDYWVACSGVGEQYNEKINFTASLYDLEGEIWEYWGFSGVKITGEVQPGKMLGFLNAVWLKIPHDAWWCNVLIPEDKSVELFREDYEKIPDSAKPFRIEKQEK